VPDANVTLSLSNQASPQIRQTANDVKALLAADTAATGATLTLAQAQARLAAASGGNVETFQRLAAAASREAFSAGDVTRALELQNLALGRAAGETDKGATSSLRFVQAEAQALKATGQWREAIELLEKALGQEGERSLQVVNAERQLTAMENQAAAAATRDADAQIRLAQAHARTASASGNHAQGLQILRSAQLTATGASEAATSGLATQIARMEVGADAARQFGESLKSSLLGIVGPAALAAGAFALVRSAIGEAEEGFKLQASFDQAHASLAVLLRGVRDSNEVWAGAARYAAEYKYTQAETTEAVNDSIPVIRKSKASIEEILGVFSRLTILKPGKTFSDAARAVGELQTGQIQSIHKVFNVAADDANRMKDEIDHGADAITVLSKYLDNAGVGMGALKTQTEGATGKMRELAKANEDFQLALSGGSGGLGLDILKARIAVTADATKVLKGDAVGAFEAIRDSGLGMLNPIIGGLNAYNIAVLDAGKSGLVWAGVMEADLPPTQKTALAIQAVRDALAGLPPVVATVAAAEADTRREAILGSQALQDQAIKIRTAASASELLSLKTKVLAAADQDVANAFLRANPRITEAGIKAAVTANLITPLTGELARLTLQINAAKAALTIGAAAGVGEGGGAGKLYATQQEAAAKARQAQILATGTERQKLAVLRAQAEEARKVYGAGSAEAIEAQTAIIREQQSIAAQALRDGKSHTTELNKQLNLHESIRDALNAQYHAQLDAAALSIKDRQDRRKEDRELAAAQRILGSGSASAEFKAAAADRIALINIERQQRAADIADKGATAGGQIIGGKVYQGIPGGAPGGAVGGGAPSGGGGVPSPGGGGGGAGSLTVNLNLDGHQIAQATFPDIVAMLHNAARQSNNAGGGRTP
jgi:hypothetical protein